MKLSSSLLVVAVGASLWVGHQQADAGVVVQETRFHIMLAPEIGANNLYQNPWGEFQSNFVLNGSGIALGSIGTVYADVSNDGFSLSNIALTRIDNQVDGIDCAVIFTVDTPITYTMSGFFRFAESGQPAKSSLFSGLYSTDGAFFTLLASSYRENSTQVLGELALDNGSADSNEVVGDLVGELQPGMYAWQFNVSFIDQLPANNAVAVGTGAGALDYIEGVGNIPEPASIAILALAGAGVQLRRRS